MDLKLLLIVKVVLIPWFRVYISTSTYIRELDSVLLGLNWSCIKNTSSNLVLYRFISPQQ